MYQALYRKWRPKTFDDVVGQSHITETLKNQVKTGRLSHAYLFIGTRGTGKTSCAKILAKAANCEHPVNGNPCNECRSCLGIDDGSIMDVVEMDAASNNGVDNIRALRDEAIFSPAVVKKRVYIVDEVHMLSASAFNALLKILEEPPEHLMFILATTELHKVPATVLSRCQRHSFKRLDTDSIIGRLSYVAQQEKLSLSSDAASLIARLSEGGMRDALSLLDQCSGREHIDIDTVYSAIGLAGKQNTVELLRCITRHDSAAALELFQSLWCDGKDPSTLLGELSDLLRDILMAAVAPKGSADLLSGGFSDSVISEFKTALSTASLINRINAIQSTLVNMRVGQAKTLCELCIIELCDPTLTDGIPQLRERLVRLENAVSSGRIAAVPAVAEADTGSGEKISPGVPADEVPFDLPERKSDMEASPRRPAADIPEQTVSDHPAPVSEEWDDILEVLKNSLPMMTYVLIADPAAASGRIVGDKLEIIIPSLFLRNNISRPDILQQISTSVSRHYGRKISVTVSDGSAVSAPVSPPSSAPVPEVPARLAPQPEPQPKDEPVIPRTSETTAGNTSQQNIGNIDDLSKFGFVSIK